MMQRGEVGEGGRRWCARCVLVRGVFGLVEAALSRLGASRRLARLRR